MRQHTIKSSRWRALFWCSTLTLTSAGSALIRSPLILILFVRSSRGWGNFHFFYWRNPHTVLQGSSTSSTGSSKAEQKTWRQQRNADGKELGQTLSTRQCRDKVLKVGRAPKHQQKKKNNSKTTWVQLQLKWKHKSIQDVKIKQGRGAARSSLGWKERTT